MTAGHRFPESDPRGSPPGKRPRSLSEVLATGIRAVLITLGGLLVVAAAGIVGFIFFVGLAFANCALR